MLSMTLRPDWAMLRIQPGSPHPRVDDMALASCTVVSCAALYLLMGKWITVIWGHRHGY